MIKLPRPTASQWIGFGLIGLGGMAVIRFWFAVTALELAVPGFSEMGLISPTLLLASGTACVLLGGDLKFALDRRSRWIVLACVALLAVFPSLMLLEHLAGVSLGVDFARVGVKPTRLNPFPGRMSPNACVAFGLSSLTILMLLRPPTALRRRLSLAFIVGVVFIGAAGCIGYLLNIERLYKLGAANRLLPPVAYGLTVLSISLWLLRERWIAEPGAGFQRHELLIGQRSIAVLAAVAIAAGVGGFAVIQPAYEQSQADGLLLTATTNADALANTLEVSAWFPRTVATRPVVGRSLDELRSKPNAPEHVDRLRRVGQDFLTAGVSGVRFESSAGLEVVTVGQLVVQPTDAALALSPELAGSKLVWKGSYILYSQHPVMAHGQEVGRITTEQPLPLFDKLVANIRRASDSSDALVCNRVEDVASCVPSRFYPKSFTIPMLDANGRPNFPINRALLGEVGVLVTKDLRDIPWSLPSPPSQRPGSGWWSRRTPKPRTRRFETGSTSSAFCSSGWWPPAGGHCTAR